MKYLKMKKENWPKICEVLESKGSINYLPGIVLCDKYPMANNSIVNARKFRS
ncbi:MAG: hypothetical protein LBI77_00355 [Puniceicoccales bacterium]|nr:hypothetical protein [Puniceicoccales bacterium]